MRSWSRMRNPSRGLIRVVCLWIAASPTLVSGGKVSTGCQNALKDYFVCNTRSGLFSACSSTDVLNDTGIQHLLGCHNSSKDPKRRIHLCRERCLEDASMFAGGAVDSPCSPNIQAMHGFGADIDIFTVGQRNEGLNITEPMFLPFANVKGMTGPSSIGLGAPDKCAQISTAHYCVLSGMIPMQQRLDGHYVAQSSQPAAGGGMGPMGGQLGFTISLGKCLPRSCNEDELLSTFTGLGGGTLDNLNFKLKCDTVLPIDKHPASATKTEQFLGWGGVPVWYPNTINITPGFLMMSAVCGTLLVLVAIGTSLDLQQRAHARVVQPLPEIATVSLLQAHEVRPAQKNVVGRFFNHWSLVRNVQSWLRTRPADQNTFACMDAIRVFSMCQVIAGHSFLYPALSVGVSNMEQFSPPHGLLGQFWFMVVPGCFYGVDSFFLLSGFLCAYGLQQKVFSLPGSRSPHKFSLMYLKFVLVRYLRLLPLEMFCIAFVYNVLPQLGTGVLWNIERPDEKHCFDGAGRDQCDSYWWTNLLFIQNLNQYLGKCFAHTWYLAADMQIYITAPLFALAYSYSRKVGWAVLAAAFVAGVAAPMGLMAHYQWVPEMILGNGRGFFQYVYMKPWCRLTPFVIGIGLAWLWQERFEAHKGRHTTFRAGLRNYALALFGLSLCFLATFGRILMYKGDLQTVSDINTNPAGKLFMYLWTGFSIPVWSVGVGIIMVLCFQDRFLPLFQDFLCHTIWQPLAKLTYAAYLIHTSILILDFCQQQAMYSFLISNHVYALISFITLSLLMALCLFLVVEKPLANLQMSLLGGGGD